MIKINYESDFKLIEGFKDGSSILAAPFRFTYYVNVSSGVYVAEYNGSEYVNCIPTEGGKVIVPFDSPKLGVGVLMVKREFFLNDSDYKDGICNLVSVERTGITLNKGATDDMGEISIEVFPFYQKGDTGKSAYDEWLNLGNEGSVADFINSLRGEPFTYEDFTEEQLQALKGEQGDDAYEVWLKAGHVGSLQDFFDYNKGKKGDKGEQGIQGIQGIQGEQGIQGIQGIQGERGERGEKGEQGVQGEKGPKGDTGEQGEPGRVMTYDDMTEAQKKDLASRVPLPELPDNLATKEDVSKAVSGKQDALTLTILDNGNIRIGNLQGQTKDFMPATPSGDPMHYAYVSAGAVYNDTNQIIQRTAPWNTEETWVKNEDGTYTYSEVPAIVQHLPNHWFLNGLGNLTNKDMNAIYEAGRLQVGVQMSNWFKSNARTTLWSLKNGGEGASFDLYYFDNTNYLEVACISCYSSVYVNNLHRSFTGKNVKIIMPKIIFQATESNKAFATFEGATNLRQVFITDLKTRFSFQYSPNIERRCILYMINNANPTSAITITLHADAYARLAEDADIVAALAAKPLVTLVSA